MNLRDLAVYVTVAVLALAYYHNEDISWVLDEYAEPALRSALRWLIGGLF